MNRGLFQYQEKSLLDDKKTYKKLEFNFNKNKEQDHTKLLDSASQSFQYEESKNSYWNPENFSLLYKTPLWNQASDSQRIKLNQLYWIAYYSQIISAEIATIFFNQTSAAGLYGIEDFRIVCDTLDLESTQERAHINAFKKISEDFELAEFGERLFTYPMRNPYAETMIYSDTNRIKQFWRNLQMRSFTLLSSGNAFIACQYFTVRGIRTLNGKMVQHLLSQYYLKHPDKENSPVPSKVSFYHFMDESFHFNSSSLISHDVLKSLKSPTAFERMVSNKALEGTQYDHLNFSTTINGIFWYDPAIFETIYKLLRTPIFGMNDQEAKNMMYKCYAEESEGMHLNAKTHAAAVESYKSYLSDLEYVSGLNKEMSIMSKMTLEKHLKINQAGLKKFFGKSKQPENKAA